MPKGYYHLTYEQRCQIYALLRRGVSKKQIALEIGIHQSTICREVCRNKGKRGYRYKQAQFKYEARRHKASSLIRKMTPDITLYVEQMLCERQWSPEQIAGRLKIAFGKSISHETIYQHIWKISAAGGVFTSTCATMAKNTTSEEMQQPVVD